MCIVRLERPVKRLQSYYMIWDMRMYLILVE